MENSRIPWTDHTFSAWEGCSKVSPGCTHCYAAGRDDRWHEGKHWGKDAPRYLHTDSYWKQPFRWDREAAAAGERRRVFSASLSDVFEDRRDLDPLRERLFDLIAQTPNLDWLLLTKRPQCIARLAARWNGQAPTNVWLGTTCEDQKRAEERLPQLLAMQAVVHFVSAEPLLGEVDLRKWLGPGKVSWVVAGGESGPNARPCNLDWKRKLMAQCSEMGAAYFMKQMGALPFDGKTGKSRITMRDRKGEDMDEFPIDLRVRDFPRSHRLGDTSMFKL